MISARKGTYRWISLGVLNLQPSEVMKVDQTVNDVFVEVLDGDLSADLEPVSEPTVVSTKPTRGWVGPLVIARGDGVRVYDEQGNGYIEAMSGLWCTSLGFDQDRLVDAATRAISPGYRDRQLICLCGARHPGSSCHRYP